MTFDLSSFSILASLLLLNSQSVLQYLGFLSYQWAFEGTTVTREVEYITHVFTSIGIFNVNLNVSYIGGLVQSLPHTITVEKS